MASALSSPPPRSPLSTASPSANPGSSGLSNTAFQLGGALGGAIVSTVAVSRSGDYLAANDGANPLVVLTEGFQSAFVACVVLAGIGAALALLLLSRPRRAPQEQLEVAPAPAAD